MNLKKWALMGVLVIGYGTQIWQYLSEKDRPAPTTEQIIGVGIGDALVGLLIWRA